MYDASTIKSFMTEINNQTDRGAGIIAASVIEDLLAQAIRQRLAPISNTRWDALFGRMKPLSTFSAKIEMGSALGLYENSLRHPLHMFREVRNKFAHRMEPLHFSSEIIADLVIKGLPKHIPKEYPARKQFLFTFGALFMIMNTLARLDTRIPPVGETHQNDFISLAFAVASAEFV